MKIEKDKFFAGLITISVLIGCLVIYKMYSHSNITPNEIESKTYSIEILFLNGENITRNYTLPKGTTIHLPNNNGNKLVLINPYCSPPCVGTLAENVKSFKVK